MPELPEVEVTRRELEPKLIGRTITEVATTKPSYFFITKPAALRKHLVGRRAERLVRIGKYLLLELDDGPQLYFRDARKFGKVEWLAEGQVSKRLGKLGIDALRAEGQALYTATRKRRIPIKTVLLDQAVLAGVGNIYADEALFLAKIHPLKRANKLRLVECDALVAAVQKVMLRSIETGGSSISDYVRPDGERGAYQDERKVYGRTGEPCHVCGTKIARKVLGQRSTHFCPQCQKR